MLWHDHFNYGAFTYAAFDPTLTTNGVLYINSDGAYALRSDTGSVLWHNPLGTRGDVYVTPSVADDINSFNPSVVAAGIDYLTGTNGRITTLYALNASTGAELWQSQKFPQVYSLLAVA